MSKQKIALISGTSGQDGSYLAELLLSKGYEVHGIIRRSSNQNLERIDNIKNLITLHYADLTDQGSLLQLVNNIRPDEVYNLASQSFVATSWEQPITTSDITALGVTRFLEAVRYVIKESGKNIKFYQASSSEMYGKVQAMPQTERTPFYPRSPYGVSKVYAHWMTINYRESYDLFAACGILYNHESSRRGLEFVTRKITNAVARIKTGKQDKLFLGNLNAKRDWGFAGDYVKAMWLMLQQDAPCDYIIATGEMHSVEEFVSIAFNRVGLDYNKYVEVDKKFLRPTEVDVLCGDATLANNKLGWKSDTSFVELVNMMVDADLERECKN